VISLIVAGLALIPIDVDLLPSSSVEKGANVHDNININVVLGISAILCITVFVLTVCISIFFLSIDG
jgi:hypothetical protein